MMRKQAEIFKNLKDQTMIQSVTQGQDHNLAIYDLNTSTKCDIILNYSTQESISKKTSKLKHETLQMPTIRVLTQVQSLVNLRLLGQSKTLPIAIFTLYKLVPSMGCWNQGMFKRSKSWFGSPVVTNISLPNINFKSKGITFLHPCTPMTSKRLIVPIMLLL